MDLCKKLEFVPGKPFQPSLMFAGKVGAYPSEAPLSCSTLGWAPGLTHKHQTRLERFARDKRSSLLRKSVINGQKSFITLGPELVNKTCKVIFTLWRKSRHYMRAKIYFFCSLTPTRGQFVEQKLMLSSSFRCDQIYKYERYDFGHTSLCYLSRT
jgi:hypothetical protein